MKKALSLILALILSLSAMIVVPVTASAKTADPLDCITSTTAASKLATPKITKLQSTTSGVKITIGKVKGAAKYAVFAKLNNKWTKLGVTKTTSFVYKAAKNNKGYFFTVRCTASNGRTFTSAYNKKGWYFTFKKPKKTNWSMMYYKYLIEHDSNLRWCDSTYYLNDEIPLALHDMDLNGVPELIVGYHAARLGIAVYTIYGGKVVYAGEMGGKSIEYSTNKKYHGIFRNDSWKSGAEGGLSYAKLSKGKLKHISVMSFSYNRGSRKETVKNKTLYNVYKRGVHGLKLYNWKEIRSDGWDNFVKHYGYKNKLTFGSRKSYKLGGAKVSFDIPKNWVAKKGKDNYGESITFYVRIKKSDYWLCRLYCLSAASYKKMKSSDSPDVLKYYGKIGNKYYMMKFPYSGYLIRDNKEYAVYHFAASIRRDVARTFKSSPAAKK